MIQKKLKVVKLANAKCHSNSIFIFFTCVDIIITFKGETVKNDIME